METASVSRGRASHGIELLARVGFAAKGVVYLAIGVLTARAAASLGGGGAQGSREALTSLHAGPFGAALLTAVAIGLAGYVVWRLVEAFADPERRGTGLRGLAIRGGMLVSAFLHAGLTIWIVRTLLGDGSAGSGGGEGARTWSARLLAQPFGAWLLGAVGVGIIAYGVAEWVRAYRTSFQKRMRSEMDFRTRRWARRIARAGLISRGIVFWIIGGFVVHAALTADPSQARGLEGALTAVGEQAYGPWLMGLVALGLTAYGVFQWVKAWYRRIRPLRG
jgi:hypothetical protein